jgi:TolB-like protein
MRILVMVLCCAAGARAADDLFAAASAAGRELAVGLAASDERAQVKSVAIEAFSDPTSAPGLGGNAADQVARVFAAASKLNTLDRARLAEFRLAAAQGKDPSLEAGKRAGAQAVLVGSLADSSGGVILVARLVSVSSGKVLASSRQIASLAQKEAAAGAVESQSIEVAMRRLSDSLARGFARLPGDARYRRLAVMPFSNVGESAQKQQIGTVVAAELATDLRRDHNLLLIERQKLTEVMGELRLQQSGAVDPASAAQIGKIADAQALVIGSASDLGDRYLVNVRVVATETGETLAADSTSVQAAGMVALASDAVVLRSRKDAVFRSLLIPGWGQIYNRQQAKGFVILGAELALIGSGVAFHIAGDNAYNRYTSATSAGQLGTDPSGQAQRLYDTAVTRYRLRNGLLIGAAGLWMLNILDAYLSGVDGDAMLSGGMASRTFRF